MAVKPATGASIRVADLVKEKQYFVTAFGAISGGNPVKNTKAVNQAIEAASQSGGGTVVVPKGEFKVYTIVLKSNVNLYLEKKSVLRAARTDITKSYEKQVGEGGNYEEPEVNLYAGIQDHGHTYFANSMFYAADEENIMIYGEGLIDGSYLDEETGIRSYVLQGGDPFDQPQRNKKGHSGEWFGNKAIALVRCKNIVLSGFSLVIGGHFAIIAEGVKNMYVEHLLVDTTRDALDVDCCQDVTVVHSVFNSLTDDALVLKASYGAGIFMPTKNVLVEDCVVSGYDAGSVYAGLYTRDKLIATDRCGPTGRVKLGTESTCGYENVTIRRVKFDRSRGFALEAVDGSDLRNIIFTDCQMDNVSSSPIFIRAGERGRFPVTGNSEKQLLVAEDGNVRMDNKNWVLPNTEAYQSYPAKRYTPSYKKDKQVSVDGHAVISVVNQEEPALKNAANLAKIKGKTYAVKYNAANRAYEPDFAKPVEEHEEYYYANANGSDHMARVSDIEISKVKITNADPRYPILIMGLQDSPIRNVTIENVDVTYRGGMKMEHAVEQRQLNTNWEYTQFETASSVQTLPWLVNTFFLKEEGLLPRVDWNPETGNWVDDPYNVPEMPGEYPEPSNWGILPAYGVYARHVENLKLSKVKLSTILPDERHALVLDDARNVLLEDVAAPENGIKRIALVKDYFRRPTNKEYLLEEAYLTTEVKGLVFKASVKEEKTGVKEVGKEIEEFVIGGLENVLAESDICEITIHAPAPGTPNDSQYSYPTIAVPETGYQFKVPTEEYELPFTVHRPFFAAVKPQIVKSGDRMEISVTLRDPATEIAEKESSAFIYNEMVKKKDFTVGGVKRECRVYLVTQMDGAEYDSSTKLLTWDTKGVKSGIYTLRMAAEDGLITEYGDIQVEVQ